MKLNKCSHFLCASCAKIKKVSLAIQVTTAFTEYNYRSLETNKLYYNIYEVLICKDCQKEKKC